MIVIHFGLISPGCRVLETHVDNESGKLDMLEGKVAHSGIKRSSSFT